VSDDENMRTWKAPETMDWTPVPITDLMDCSVIACGRCGALVLDAEWHIERHVLWHAFNDTPPPYPAKLPQAPLDAMEDSDATP